MAIFQRKQKTPSSLPEVEKYYDAEKRDRAGLAWLMALISIVCVVALIVGLFFGGRWAYRRLKSDDKPPAVTTSDTKKPTSGAALEEGAKTPATPNPDDSAAATTPPASAATPQNGNTGVKPNNLTSTGPESIIPIFLTATLAGTLLYRFKIRQTKII